MAQTTVTQLTVAEFASSLKMPAEALLEHLKKAGIAKNSAGDSLTEQDKSRLLDFLRRAHGATEAKTKITLTRRETSEIRAQDSQGKSRTVQVEVRKKRVLVKRDIPEVRPAEVVPEPVVEPVSIPTPEPVLEPVVEPVVAPVAEPVVAPVVETAPEAEQPKVVEEIKPKGKGKGKSAVGEAVASSPQAAQEVPEVAEKPKAATPAKSVVKKVVTRASIIGEEQQRLRAEEERRNAELRARQEAEFLEKQQRIADLARLKQDAEAKAAAARAAEVAAKEHRNLMSDSIHTDRRATAVRNG